ncbi:MAG: hypothetical protein O2944_05745 [Proteobacteria bacterium]|nr:hypothetical protein [Pseudomonadota bacterium]
MKAPTRLNPLPVPGHAASPPQTAPVLQQPAALPGQPVLPPPGVRRADGIQIGGLSSIDPESLGYFNRSDGGLGAEMWRDTTRSEAIRLINGMPDRPKSRILRALASRLLLSRALAPAASSDTQVGSLLAARGAKLISMGDVEGALRLLMVTPQQERPSALDATDARIQLLLYNNARACGLARASQSITSDDFIQRLLVHCNALEGKVAEMSLGISMLREIAGDDVAMTTLAEAVATHRKNVVIEAISDPKPIHLALSRAAGAVLPPEIAKSDDPLVVYGAVRAPNLVIGARVEAAERGVAAGIVSADALRRLYAEVPFSPDDKANALTRADDVGGAGARTLLYQAAAAQTVPSG